jgi:gas vesicle protein
MINRRNQLYYTIAALGIGTAVGALVMWLFAPRSGRETRTDIVDKSRRISSKVIETAGQTSSRTGKMVGDLTQQARDAAGNIFRRGQVAAEDYMSNIEEEAKSKSVPLGFAQ